MAGSVFAINTRDGASLVTRPLTSCSIISRGCSLFRLLSNILVALKYFSLKKFDSHMGADLVLKVLGLQKCAEVYWKKTAVKGVFASYDFPIGEIYGLSEKGVQERSA